MKDLPQPIVLEGEIIRLRPLEARHAFDIWPLVGDDYETWRWANSGAGIPHSAEELHEIFAAKIERAVQERAHYFTFEHKPTGHLVGSSAFLDIRPTDRHVEIGSTFIAPDFRGGIINYEAKLLMLTDAFERQECVRVTIKANAKNVRSRKSIEKIGATFEGTLRNQRQERDGSWRDAAYYSIIVEEWPEIKESLEKKLSI